MQRDDKLASEGRMVSDADLLEHMFGYANVTEVDSTMALGQRERQAQGQGPLGLHNLGLAAHWRVQAEDWGPVLVGPAGSSLVPGLVPQQGVLMTVQTVDDQVHWAHRQVWMREEEEHFKGEFVVPPAEGSAVLIWDCCTRQALILMVSLCQRSVHLSTLSTPFCIEENPTKIYNLCHLQSLHT